MLGVLNLKSGPFFLGMCLKGRSNRVRLIDSYNMSRMEWISASLSEKFSDAT